MGGAADLQYHWKWKDGVLSTWSAAKGQRETLTDMNADIDLAGRVSVEFRRGKKEKWEKIDKGVYENMEDAIKFVKKGPSQSSVEEEKDNKDKKEKRHKKEEKLEDTAEQEDNGKKDKKDK